MDRSSLISKLKSETSSEVVDALAEISRSGNMHDLSVTIGMIRNADPTISRAAVKATDTIIREAIITNYHKLGSEGRRKLAEIIEKIHPDTVQELIKEIHKANDENKIHGLMLLGVLRRRPDVKHLIETLMQSNNERVRATATQAISNFPEKGEQVLLLKKLNDPDERVRANAVEALGDFGDRKMIYSIKRLLNDGNNRVRANAIKSLYQLGDNRIENELVLMLSDRDTSMIASALWLINELGVMSVEIKEKCVHLRNHVDPIIQRNLDSVKAQFEEVTEAIKVTLAEEKRALFIANNKMVGGSVAKRKKPSILSLKRS